MFGKIIRNIIQGAEVAKTRGEPDVPNRRPQPCRREGALAGGPNPPGQAGVGQEADGLLLSHCLPIPASVHCTQSQVSQLTQANKNLIQMPPLFRPSQVHFCLGSSGSRPDNSQSDLSGGFACH